MKIAVINNSKRCICFNKLDLLPGTNLVDEKTLKLHEKSIKKHDDIEIKSKTKDSSSIDGHNAKIALDLIKNTNDEDILAEWKNQEASAKNRPAIIDAIDKQLEKIESTLIRKDKK